MRRALSLISLLALAFAGRAEAVTMYQCVGAQVDPAYVQAFDGVRGQLVDGSVRYPEKRWYREKQGWGTLRGVEPGHNSEHMHMAGCFPNGETWLSPNADRHVDIKFTFHDMLDYDLVSVNGSFVSCNATDCSSQLSRGAFDPAEVAAAVAALEPVMDASAGHTNVTSAFRSFTVRDSATNGLKELRWGMTVQEEAGTTALFDLWRLDGRSYATDAYAGLPTVQPISEHVRYVRNRQVVDFIDHNGNPKSDYHHAGFQEIEGIPTWQRAHAHVAVAVGATVDGVARITDGGGPACIHVDPNFHGHPDNLGKVTPYCFDGFSSSGEDLREPFSLPTATLSSGWHKLVLVSHDIPECARLNRECPAGVRNDWSDVEVFPFKVS